VAGGGVAGGGVLGVEGVVPWVLSGRDVGGLRGQAERLREWMADGDASVGDVGLSLAGRCGFERRAVVVGGAREELLDGVGSVAGGVRGLGVVEGAVDGGIGGGGVVFVFPGQGSQWSGMAVELMDESPVFAERMRLCEEAFTGLVDWSLERVLRGTDGEPGFDRVDVVQPALFAVMVSLAALWRACGVEPCAVVGHSQGEIAAACVAGGLSLQDAARLVVLRSKALRKVSRLGGMVSVGLSLSEVEGWLEGREGLGVGALNGPGSVVVSGERGALDALHKELLEAGVRAREVLIDYASHSHQMEMIRDELLAACEGVVALSGDVPFHSTVTGERMDMTELDGEYWFRNLRERVVFEDVVGSLLREGRRTFVEVSAHPVLAVGAQETAERVLGVEGAGGDGSQGAGETAVASGSRDALVLGTLRREHGGLERFLTSLGEVWVRGVGVDWGRVFAETGAKRVELPTYAFQRRRYWLDPDTPAGSSFAGQQAAGHPLLEAAMSLADGGWLFTGRLSQATHPWLAEHSVMGSALLPATAFLEIALHAATTTGCGDIAELTLQAPLTLPEQGAVHLQATLERPSLAGERTLTIHSRPHATATDTDVPWTHHATATLTSSQGPAYAGARLNGEWPPPGAEAASVEDIYDRLAERGHDYGPALQGLQAVWRRDEELFAEVALTEEQRLQAADFVVHPALLDAAGQLLLADGGDGEGGSVQLVSAWRGVSLHAIGASRLRIHLTPSGAEGQISGANGRASSTYEQASGAQGASIVAVDEAGELVIAIDSLCTRAFPAEQLGAPREPGRESLFQVDWMPVGVPPGAQAEGSWAVLGAPEAGLARALEVAGAEVEAYRDLGSLAASLESGATPTAVLVDCATDPPGRPHGLARYPVWVEGREEPVEGREEPVEGREERVENTDVPGAVSEGASLALALLQAWVADERLAATRLVLVTRGAVAAGDGEDVTDLVGAAVWGLVRSAQSEHPDRFTLVDLDSAPASVQLLDGALASGEPQLAVREGAALVPRLARAAPAGGGSAAARAGTALVTGGTGGLGALVARHLVAEHEVRSLILVSRSGEKAPGARELRSELEGLGAHVQLVACDVGVRSEVERLLASVPAEHPLSIVVHAAGVLDDGVIESLSAERVARVLAPKVDAAWHLHELTQDSGLAEFVLFSSAASTLGAAGQGNYAAANAFLDALAAHRRARGLPAVSIAWGMWAQASGMTGALGAGEQARIARNGLLAMTSAEGLELFDAARGGVQALLVALRLDAGALRARARAGMAPALLGGLVRTPLRRSSEGAGVSLAERLAGVPDGERERIVRGLVREETAFILGHASALAVEEQRPFRELGFDSLMAVELRNRLYAATGLPLPTSLVFDHPTVAAVSRHLLDQAVHNGTPAADLEGDLDKLDLALSGIAENSIERARVAARLQALLLKLDDGEAPIDALDAEDDLQHATDEEVFELIERELGLEGREQDG
jgi:acyl transferase domain-containing protein/acyl carrier protein